MGLRIHDIAPDFSVDSNEGQINFHQWKGDSWAIIFSHPKDFTPICTTEFSAAASLADEWAKRNTKVLGVSVDGVEDHKKWISDIEGYEGNTVTFPIIADTDLAVSKLYDMLPADAILPDGRTAADSETVRTVFIIAPDNKVKLMMSYPMNVGRNFAEILRALDALQTAETNKVAMPANWMPGGDVIIPLSLNDEQAKEKFGEYNAALPYLRKTSL